MSPAEWLLVASGGTVVAVWGAAGLRTIFSKDPDVQTAAFRVFITIWKPLVAAGGLVDLLKRIIEKLIT